VVIFPLSGRMSDTVMKITTLSSILDWVVMLCTLEGGYQRFGATLAEECSITFCMTLVAVAK
jgi:hypothetical protein